MNTSWSKPTKYVVGISLVLLGLYILYLARPVIPILVVAALIAVVLRPVILWLHHRLRMPRGLAVALVYLILALLTPLALLLVIPPVIDALTYIINLDYAAILQEARLSMQGTLQSIQAARLPVAGLDQYVDQTIDTALVELQEVSLEGATPPPLTTILSSLSSVVSTTFDLAAGLVGTVFSQAALLIFIFLASIYISLDAHTYRSSLLRIVPAAYQSEIAILLRRIERTWNAFFRGELILMVVIGVISWFGLTALGVPGALYLAIIAGLLELIPNLGPIIATVPAVIVALLQGSAHLDVSRPVLALLVIVLYVVIQQLENSVIVPRVLGEAVDLPALVVMSGVLAGASVGGILGALLAIPIIATVREIVRYAYRKMLGEEPFLLTEPAPAAPPRTTREVLDQLRERLRALWARLQAALRRRSDPTPVSKSDPDAEKPQNE